MRVPKWIDKKPEVRTLKKWEAAWLAGIIDSDGSIGLYNYGREGRRVQVQIANVHFGFLEKIRETIGCGSNVNHVPSASHKGHQRLYNYSVKGSCRCFWILRQISPFLVIKRDKAEAIIGELCRKPFGRWASNTEEKKVLASVTGRSTWRDPDIRAKRLAGMKTARENKKCLQP